jgi:hypothetical protein
MTQKSDGRVRRAVLVYIIVCLSCQDCKNRTRFHLQNPCFGNGQLLAVGGEEGVVTIASTESVSALENGSMDGSWRPRAHWCCHRNSIFDLAWVKVGTGYILHVNLYSVTDARCARFESF